MTEPSITPPKPTQPPTVGRLRGWLAPRLPDWRTGQTTDITTDQADMTADTTPDTGADNPAPDNDKPQVSQVAEADNPEDTGEDTPDTPGERTPPADPGPEPAAGDLPNLRALLVELVEDAAHREAADRAAPAPGKRRPRSLLQMRNDLHPRTRALLYNATAAWLGHQLGLAPAVHAALTACGNDTRTPVAVGLGTALCLLTAHYLDRRTRGWWPPLAWAARIPLASCVLALALYTPDATL